MPFPHASYYPNTLLSKIFPLKILQHNSLSLPYILHLLNHPNTPTHNKLKYIPLLLSHFILSIIQTQHNIILSEPSVSPLSHHHATQHCIYSLVSYILYLPLQPPHHITPHHTFTSPGSTSHCIVITTAIIITFTNITNIFFTLTTSIIIIIITSILPSVLHVNSTIITTTTTTQL